MPTCVRAPRNGGGIGLGMTIGRKGKELVELRGGSGPGVRALGRGGWGRELLKRKGEGLGLIKG